MSSEQEGGMPPEWAIKRADAELRNEPYIAGALRGPALRAFARYIAQHEKELVDPLYEALKAVVELGRYDTREQTQLLRHELEQRGLKIVEVQP